MKSSGLALPLRHPGDSIRVVTAAVTALLLVVVALPPLVVAEATTLRDATTATSGIMIAQTVITIAVTATVTMSAETTAAIVTASVLATVLVAPKIGSAMPRMIARDARMIGNAVTRSGRSFPMAKTGKVCSGPLGSTDYRLADNS